MQRRLLCRTQDYYREFNGYTLGLTAAILGIGALWGVATCVVVLRAKVTGRDPTKLKSRRASLAGETLLS